MTRLQSITKEQANLYKYLNHILSLTIFWKLQHIKQEVIPKQFQETFEAEIGELQYGSSAVVHSYSDNFNILWFPKNVEMLIHCWTHILKRSGHFIFT